MFSFILARRQLSHLHVLVIVPSEHISFQAVELASRNIYCKAALKLITNCIHGRLTLSAKFQQRTVLRPCCLKKAFRLQRCELVKKCRVSFPWCLTKPTPHAETACARYEPPSFEGHFTGVSNHNLPSNDPGLNVICFRQFKNIQSHMAHMALVNCFVAAMREGMRSSHQRAVFSSSCVWGWAQKQKGSVGPFQDITPFAGCKRACWYFGVCVLQNSAKNKKTRHKDWCCPKNFCMNSFKSELCSIYCRIKIRHPSICVCSKKSARLNCLESSRFVSAKDGAQGNDTRWFHLDWLARQAKLCAVRILKHCQIKCVHEP